MIKTLKSKIGDNEGEFAKLKNKIKDLEGLLDDKSKLNTLSVGAFSKV